MSIPEAGLHFYGLSKNGSYDAAARGEIPYLQIGRLKRVPVVAMERKMQMEQAFPAPTSPDPAPKPERYPRSVAVRRQPQPA
jgi:hypothetical protein